MLIQDEKFSVHNSNEFVQIDRSIISAPRTALHTVTAGFFPNRGGSWHWKLSLKATLDESVQSLEPLLGLEAF